MHKKKCTVEESYKYAEEFFYFVKNILDEGFHLVNFYEYGGKSDCPKFSVIRPLIKKHINRIRMNSRRK